MKRKILVATTNPGKAAELQEMLDLDVNWLSLADFPDIPEVKEDGTTFIENARKKAIGYASTTGLWTIADDSGLVIDALDGAPGIESARFSGEKSPDRTLIDHKNIAKVLKLLKGVPTEKRTARFVCSLCLVSSVEILMEKQGTLEGLITEEEIGENGFGYDPIFFVPKLKKTVAQLTREEKNAISHRGNAIRKLKPLLADLLTNSEVECDKTSEN
ncbi:MAG: XTP/dITP diphosphatase [Phycisphaerae bacterium]|nr:XTP/dITP diphosphatase [Phycisphaerae bacterium]NIP54329.1 XTP/dITP diphosphatase [Phycisphaerae bacterium]NIS53196.1 XTP/dITP diphosphatase [Phycisphaerae bacterium]NIU10682.1 XTP/dITP diphosphatase [Phycisphaerae bacterium]NIU58450.1 XTP/dITP diphosphatase [Phycisphaerae bacterium]